MTEDYISKLQEDLRTKLYRLCWTHNEPALHVVEHFAELRRQVDYDAERLLSKIQTAKCETENARKDTDVNGTRLEFIRILEELEKRTGLQPKPQTPANEIYASFEQRVEAFKDSSISLDDLEELHDQLAQKITDETSMLEKRILGEQTIIYRPHQDETELGSLIYFGDTFLNRQQIDQLMKNICHHQTSVSALLEPESESFEHNKNKQVIESLSRGHLSRFAKGSKFFCIAKTKEEYKGYAAEGSSIETELVSYQFEESDCELRAGGIAGLDKSSNLFDFCSSPFCKLSIEHARLDSLYANLLPSPVDRLVSLQLDSVHLESFDPDFLSQCVNMKQLKMQVTFSKQCKFDLAFLGALTKLETLQLSLLHTPSDLSVLKKLTQLKSLKLESLSFFYAEKLPRLSKVVLEQILSASSLETLEFICFEIDVIDREMLSKCSRLETFKLAKNPINEDACMNSERKARASDGFDSTACVKQLTHIADIRAPFNFACLAGMMSMKKLSLTGSFITDLPRGVFKDLPSLERLDLDKNLIRHINNGVFGELDKLTTLKLDGNPIESIEPNAFARLHNLNTLSLEGCRLKSIDSEMFNGLFNLEMLFIISNLIERIEVIAENGHRINVAKANLSEEEKQLVKKHLFRDLSCLKWFFLLKNELRELDLNCFINLKNLSHLDLTSNKINELSGEVQGQLLSKLCYLRLNDNQLASIDKRALPKTICFFDLSKNRLKWLDEDFFAEFTNLNKVNLAENELTWTVNEATFARGRYFFEINLSQNQTIRVAEGLFRETSSVCNFECDFTEHFPSHLPFETLRIRSLTPAVIRILQGASDLPENNQKVIKCSISNCSIKSLVRNREREFDTPDHFNMSWLQKYTQLKQFDFSNNIIETLDDSELFAGFKSITKISLCDNRLNHIHRDIFKCLPCLETIDLSGNNLSSIDMGLFRHLANLKDLNLSSNLISFINLAWLFRICPSLQTLNIADNQLDDRSTAELVNARTCCHLMELVLVNNRFKKVGFVRDMTCLRHLNLRGNQIETVMSDKGENLLGRLSKLTHLDLSQNCIRSLRDEMFSHSWLYFLDLSSNPLDFQLDSVLSELI